LSGIQDLRFTIDELRSTIDQVEVTRQSSTSAGRAADVNCERWRWLLAMLGGLILSCAFPRVAVPGAAWVGPGLLLFAAIGTNRRRAFWIGYVGGLVHFLSSLYWLLCIPYTWHGIPLGPGAGWLALSAYCALYPAIWVWLCWKVFCRTRDEDSLTFKSFAAGPWAKRALWCLLCATIWVGLEVVRGWFLSGFPWNFLGASQFHISTFIQIASITGVYGVSFLVIWMSVALGSAMLALVYSAQKRTAPWAEIALPFVVCAAAMYFGMEKFRDVAVPDKMLKVALIQPSIPQTVIWDPQGEAGRFEKVMALSEKALASKPDVLIWPESALPAWTQETSAALVKLAVDHHVWIILSADDVEPPKSPQDPAKYFNAAFLLSPEGAIKEVYRKRRLVIFGEYVPFSSWLPFLKWLTPIEGQFTPGIRSVQFDMKNLDAKTSVLICFEDMFPAEAREHVLADTDFLVNVTNDGWFGQSGEQWQHAMGAVFRAVENGVPLVRCTNNGLTCWFDSEGRTHELFRDKRGTIYGEGFLVSEVPLRLERGRTFYNRHGDVFGWTCVGAAAVLLFLSFRRRQ
jgi:apolipoprotein N-acyltransferase